jgi:putative ABC transport system permease protein
MATDKDHAWIINETAVKAFGFGSPEQAIGQTLSWHPWDGNNPDSLKTGRVIGIVKDFNYKSLYDKIEPAVLQIYPLAAWKVAVRVKTANIDASIDHVRTSWNKFAAGYPIEYKFLDENFEQMYQSEDKLETLLWIFTGIAIFVACLGLFGLAAYTAETRRKEVGIRKTLGASVKGVVLLLSKDFITPVIISILIASPIGWYFMNNWLQHFAYRVPIQAWIFLLAGFSTLLITLLTIGYQAIRAAIVNPIQSLRTE